MVIANIEQVRSSRVLVFYLDKMAKDNDHVCFYFSATQFVHRFSVSAVKKKRAAHSSCAHDICLLL